jgi:outer membrane immunogenic protein
LKLLIATLVSSVALVGAARAADAIVYDVPAPAAPVVPENYNWTGWYVGVFGGLGAGDSEFALDDGDDFDGTVDVSARGAFGGAQIGADWQTGNWVFGAVADIAATNFGAEISSGGGLGDNSLESSLDYLGTVRARAGYAFDRTLFYAHGGWAYGQMSQTVVLDGTTVFDDDVGKSGYTVGAGVEHAFTDRLSFQTEYSYIDLGEDDVFSDGTASLREDNSFHMIKAAINFRF